MSDLPARRIVSLRVPEARLTLIDGTALRLGLTRTEYLLRCEETVRTGIVEDPGTHAGHPKAYIRPSGGKCRHPVARRIGDQCGDCGATVRR